MGVPPFSSSPVEGHLGCFQSLMIVEGFHVGELTVKKKNHSMYSVENRLVGSRPATLGTESSDLVMNLAHCVCAQLCPTL